MILMLGLLAVSALACNKDTQPAQPQVSQPAPLKLGDPTYVKEGKTPEDHVTDYFNAYKEQRLDDAFKMQPAENKAKQPLDQFVSLRKGMPISEYKILPTETAGDQSIIKVEYSIGQYGTWVSTWTFEKKGDRWLALNYKADPKQ